MQPLTTRLVIFQGLEINEQNSFHPHCVGLAADISDPDYLRTSTHTAKQSTRLDTEIQKTHENTCLYFGWTHPMCRFCESKETEDVALTSTSQVHPAFVRVWFFPQQLWDPMEPVHNIMWLVVLSCGKTCPPLFPVQCFCLHLPTNILWSAHHTSARERQQRKNTKPQWARICMQQHVRPDM